jgi:hypothetical protein
LVSPRQQQQQSLLAAATAASCPVAQLQQGQAAQELALLLLAHLLCPQDCRPLLWPFRSCSSLQVGLVRQELLLVAWRHWVLESTFWDLRLQAQGCQGQGLFLRLRLLLHSSRCSTWGVRCQHKQRQEEGPLGWQAWAVLWGQQMQQRR